jgi:hypothetical protein
MTEAERTANLIQTRLPRLKRGTLRLWGQWFGRPYDNIHTVVGASADGPILEIYFDQGETLQIELPRGAVIGDGQFVIHHAASVRWEWNAYGNPSGRRYFEQYVCKGDEIEATTDVDWYTPDLRPSATAHAVEIV